MPQERSLSGSGKESEFSAERLQTMRHSSAHVLAVAVLRLYPEAKLATGPAIANGFYYDFEFEKPLKQEDLGAIQSEMEKIKKEALSFQKIEVSIGKAREIMEEMGQDYKVELLDIIKTTGDTSVVDEGVTSEDKEISIPEKVTLYSTGGEFLDLCRGPHVENTSQIGFFKLDSLAASHWRDTSQDPKFTRIYGLSFASEDELAQYISNRELARERDHRKVGPELKLFMFHETAPGMPYWLPNGLVVMNELVTFWREEHKKRGYQEIKSPLLNKKELYETSGHWEHYRENMFLAHTEENETYALKPMNCPNAMVVFASQPRSYRDLPLRLSDTDTLHRLEKSGVLNGLLRVREFAQDDAHNFVTEDQIKEEYRRIFEITDLFYSVFDLPYSFRMGTRPERFMGDPETWSKAEQSLLEILDESGKPYTVLEGDGAFYGPKIDILMKDVLGREWQMGTIQLDFQLPKNFNLTYTDKDGQERTPVTIHRVVYGSLERFFGILIEHTGGALPTWLAPVQARIIPVSDDRHMKYARKVQSRLLKSGLRVEIEERGRTVNYKVRAAELEKIPYTLVVGDKEAETNQVSVRARGQNNSFSTSVTDFKKVILAEIKRKR